MIAALRLNPRHHDAGTRLLLIGLFGLGFVMLVDWMYLMLVGRHGLSESFLEAARVVATVGALR